MDNYITINDIKTRTHDDNSTIFTQEINIGERTFIIKYCCTFLNFFTIKQEHELEIKEKTPTQNFPIFYSGVYFTLSKVIKELYYFTGEAEIEDIQGYAETSRYESEYYQASQVKDLKDIIIHLFTNMCELSAQQYGI